MTGQTLLDYMELLNQELQLQSGEVNVTRGLLALNAAQDYFESVAATYGKIFGSTTGTVTTSAATESTAFPAGLLRIDRLQLLSPSTSRPIRELTNIKRAGGHATLSSWPLNNFLITSSSGSPAAYWANGGVIFWNPLPDATHTVRYYGFKVAADITAVGTFVYPDIVALPLASFAVKLFQSGLGDGLADITAIAVEAFTPVLEALSNFNRDGAAGLEYTQVHTE